MATERVVFVAAFGLGILGLDAVLPEHHLMPSVLVLNSANTLSMLAVQD